MLQSLNTALSPLEFRPWISASGFPKLRTAGDMQLRDCASLDNFRLLYPASSKSLTRVSVESAIEVLMVFILPFILFSISEPRSAPRRLECVQRLSAVWSVVTQRPSCIPPPRRERLWLAFLSDTSRFQINWTARQKRKRKTTVIYSMQLWGLSEN